MSDDRVLSNLELTVRMQQIEGDLDLTNDEVRRVGIVAAQAAARAERIDIDTTGRNEAILSELQNVKRELTDAARIVSRQGKSEEEVARQERERRREVFWRRFWRIAMPVTIAFYLAAVQQCTTLLQVPRGASSSSSSAPNAAPATSGAEQ